MSTAPAGTVAKALADMPETMRLLDKLDAQERLRDFVPLVWNVIEPPTRPLVWGWAADAICEHLQAVTDEEITRLVINVPPGCMKSLLTDVLWPAWEWGPKDMPHLRYVCSSYSEALTVRDNRRARNIIQSPVYQELWGERFHLMADQNAKIRFDTDKMGFKIATSVGGLGTGERGDRFIVDDPHNIKDGESEAKRESALQWFTEVVPTRLNDPEKSAIIVIMQRVHGRDVSGIILREELNYEWLCLPMEHEKTNRCFTSIPHPNTPTTKVTRLQREQEPVPRWYTEEEYAAEATLPPGHMPEWQELTLQDPRIEEGELLWPERFSTRHVEEDLKPALRAWGGTYAEAGQLQQRPAPRGGGMFQRDDFNYLDRCPTGGKWVRGYDLANSKRKRSPWTVGVKMGIVDGRVIISDVRRFRKGPGEVETRIKAIAEADGRGVVIDIPQDPGQAGKSQKTAMARMLHGFRVRSSPESGAKEDRAIPLAAQSELQNLYLVRAPWNDAFVSEACLFPNGPFKDQIDGASRAYARLVGRRPQQLAAGPQVIRAA